MEFGEVGFNGFSSPSSDHAPNQKWCGSAAIFKQEMPLISSDTHDFRPSKVAKLSNNDFPPSKNPQSKHSSSFVFSDAQQLEHNMLSFSSPKSENKNLLQRPPFAHFQHPTPSYCKNAGVNTSMYLLNGIRGAFTTSQWVELEQQALIYKYIIANEPIPPNLLIPIKRALESAGFCSFPAGLLRPNSYGWGPFHLGFSNSSDPEPGRCRRTDGKKWRCSRDAVPDQKYCERHMNRGRHRSRKPVEGHPGHSVSRATTNKTTFASDLMNMSTSSSATLVVPGGGASNNFAIGSNQSKDLHSVASNHLPSALINRRMQDATGLGFLSPSTSLNSGGDTFSAAKDHVPYAEAASTGFAFATTDALLNSTQRSSSSSVYSTYGSTCSHDLNAQKSDPRHSLHPFMDDRSGILWPKVESQSDRTQLSISIPAAPADYMSSTSSPTGEKVSLSPLRLSRELDAVRMGLAVGASPNEHSHNKLADWVPVPWEASMGGPLGEVLKTTSSSSGDQSKNVSAISLLSNGPDGSLQLTSSPTGVLQRTAFGSLSNSSAVSSPLTEYGSSALGSSSAMPAL